MADIKNGVHGCTAEENYVAPTDPLIQERLEWFRDQKLALFIHWGAYSQIGIDASWSLVDSEAARTRKDIDWTTDPEDFRAEYVGMAKSFNPIRFRPEKWANFAVENGFKYLIFTTKHHDGFCMFDSQYTDYKITGEDCPFHVNRYANVTKELFDAFRRKGLGIAAYFSKPDWHCPYFWAEGMDQPPAATPCPTYDPAKHPELWEQFIQFTKGQILELIKDYGKIDILWLDGGMVKPKRGMDIRMSEIVAEARKLQPWLICADRTVGGENENYITPEQCVPDRAIRVPWESCVTIGSKWAYRYSDEYKSSETLVRMLIDTVSRGGNLALNIGPQPNGELPLEAIREVQGLGNWLKNNGDAIYGTRAMETVQVGDVRFTQKGDAVYALIPLSKEDRLPETLLIPYKKEIRQVVWLETKESCRFEQTSDGIRVFLPSTDTPPLALAFKMV